MIRAAIASALALGAALALAGCNFVKDDTTDKPAAGPPGGAPPLPPYQMRAQLGAKENRLKPSSDGATLFSHHCGACHLDFGMGTNVITAQLVPAGKPPEQGLLANRDDLTADYVKAVVRGGKGAMPRQTRVDITDAELDKVADWLATHNKAAGK
jgi:mono/diheme cytochrome c family protein